MSHEPTSEGTGSSRPSRARAYAGVAAFAAAAVGAYFAGRVSATPVHLLPSPTTVSVDVARSPNVLTAMRDLARLQTEQFHFERTVDMTRTESRFYGVIEGNKVKLQSLDRGTADFITFTFDGTLSGDTISGPIHMGEYLTAKFTARRHGYPAQYPAIRVPGGPPLAN